MKTIYASYTTYVKRNGKHEISSTGTSQLDVHEDIQEGDTFDIHTSDGITFISIIDQIKSE